jgi:serine/threonine protein phosphatase PrpC
MVLKLVIIIKLTKHIKKIRQFYISCLEVLKDEIIIHLNSSRFFSILSDGYTDKSIREQELVRFVDKDGNVKTKLAELGQLEHGHAEGVND